MLRSSASLSRGRAEPAPPRDGQAMGTRPSGGKPRDGAKGGFLGGTRSARPRGKAGHEPRHNMIIGGKGTPGALAGPRFGQARALPAGVRSPPLRGWTVRGEMALRGDLGTTRKAVLSEGCALRVRTVRPEEWQGIALAPVVLRQAGGRNGATFGFGVMPSFRACGARPSPTGRSPMAMVLEGALRENARGGLLPGDGWPGGDRFGGDAWGGLQ